MIDIDIPLDSGHAGATQGLLACVSSVTEIPLEELPRPAADLPSTVASLRTWLAGRGLGLVPIENPSGFHWPGYWIAVLGGSDGTGDSNLAAVMFGTPAGVVLSPQDSGLLGRAAARLGVERGYVVAPFDPVSRTDPSPPSLSGHVVALAIAPHAEAEMRQVSEAHAIPGRGVEGDRYAEHAGTFTPRRGSANGHDLTLIEAEVLDDLGLQDRAQLGYVEARRNVVTRGIDLNSLVGRRFRVGDVECVGRRLCEPCAHLERLTRSGVLRALIHRGGLRADVLTEGTICEGDEVEGIEDAGGASH